MASPPSADAPEALDGQVRRADPDRWLASRFIQDTDRRGAVVALYALNDELARVGQTVTQPLIGEIRLAWWRDRIEDLFEGAAVVGHPALHALTSPVRSGALPRALFDAMIEARHADLEPTPFSDQAALVAYLDGTAGALMGLAARALDAQAALSDVVQAGRAWGLAGLHQAHAAWRARGRDWVPKAWTQAADEDLGRRVRVEVDAALKLARRETRRLPVAAFPAVAYAALAKAHAQGRRPTALETRTRLVIATALGRL